MSNKIDPNDPNAWPVVECEPTDVFLGASVHDCTPHLTDEQKAWPAVECEPTDVFLDPALVLDLTLREGAEPGEYVHGTAALLRALSAHEESLGGSGLVLDKRQHPAPQGKTRLVLRPKSEVGARERLQKLTALLTDAAKPAWPSAVVGTRGPIVECRVSTLAGF